MKEAVFNWLKAGANRKEGATLFLAHAGNAHPFARLLAIPTPGITQALIISLCRRAGIEPPHNPTHPPQPTTGNPHPAPQTFRQHWPFLADPNCPPELKILATNKINAWQNYTAAHAALFDCFTVEQQFNAVKACVENYIENRSILAEFEHYKQHGSVLGGHPVFQELKQLRELRQLRVIDLVKLKDKLEHNIWRITSEMSKKDKPHLDIDRQASITAKKKQLAEIDRILQEHA